MRVGRQTIELSATDLANHLSCRHLTSLNLRLAKGELPEPDWNDPHLVVLRQRGFDHEAAYIDHLRSKGLAVADLASESDETRASATWTAMRRGVPVIVQASLAGGRWRGRADVLLRVDHPSKSTRLGDWSYEAVDCKLGRETKAETILQLCLYSELLAELQDAEPEFLHVIRPHVGFEPESYRVSSFAAYYRVVKSALDEAVESDSRETYPEPVSHCDICRWWKQCDGQRRRDDHLSFVAGASRLQRKELATQSVATLTSLARLPLPIPFHPSRGAREGYARIREQARVQLEARVNGQSKYELLPAETGKGFFRLPSPSAGDIFLDLEGDPFVGEGGLEYLFGVVTLDAGGGLDYKKRWSLNRVVGQFELAARAGRVAFGSRTSNKLTISSMLQT